MRETEEEAESETCSPLSDAERYVWGSVYLQSYRSLTAGAETSCTTVPLIHRLDNTTFGVGISSFSRPANLEAGPSILGETLSE